MSGFRYFSDHANLFEGYMFCYPQSQTLQIILIAASNWLPKGQLLMYWVCWVIFPGVFSRFVPKRAKINPMSYLSLGHWIIHYRNVKLLRKLLPKSKLIEALQSATMQALVFCNIPNLRSQFQCLLLDGAARIYFFYHRRDSNPRHVSQ